MDNKKVFGNPIEWYPNLSLGNLKQWENFIIKGDGRWVYWPELDEDLDVESFISYTRKEHA